jgi:predicted lipid-binding transport protein (Tim44 family)
MRKAFIWSITLFAVVLLWSLPDDADARRLGGGRSFGTKPQYQRNAPKPTPPQQDGSAARQQSQSAPQASPMAARPGLFGGAGGMLGGFLMGGLIGSMLFGGGHGFGGPGLFDIILIGGGLLLLYRFLRSRKTAIQGAGPMTFQSHVPGLGTADLRGQQPSGSKVILPGFDEAEFLKGAKAAYARLQASWDKRDLEDIRQFTAPEVWEEIRRHASEDPTPGRTEIVLINGSLQDVKRDGDRTVATVFFDVLLREGQAEDVAKSVQELWHFSKEESVPGSFWRLEGIQQVD